MSKPAYFLMLFDQVSLVTHFRQSLEVLQLEWKQHEQLRACDKRDATKFVLCANRRRTFNRLSVASSSFFARLSPFALGFFTSRRGSGVLEFMRLEIVF